MKCTFFQAMSSYNSRQYLNASNEFKVAISHAETENRNCLDVFHFNNALNDFFLKVTESSQWKDDLILKAFYYGYKEYNIYVLLVLICEEFNVEFEGKGAKQHYQKLKDLKNPEAIKLYDNWKEEIFQVNSEKKMKLDCKEMLQKEFLEAEENAKLLK